MIKFKCLLFILSLVTISVFGQWSTSQLSAARSLLSSSSIGNKIYVAGGATYSANQVQGIVDIYDTESQTWSTASLSLARFALASTSTAENIYFAGGVTNLNTAAVSMQVDIYNPTSDTWQTSELSESRGALTSTSNGTLVLFAGGINNFLSGSTSQTVDIYNEETGEWTSSELSVPRGYFTSTTLFNKAYFAGGTVGLSGGSPIVTDRIDIYDYTSNTWTIDSLSIPRGGLAAAALGNKVFFAGGHTADNTALNIIDIYNIDSGTWSTDTLSQARGELTATVLNNKVFFAGGYSDYINLTMSDRVDIYDESTGTWSTASLSQARSEVTSAAANHSLLISGGGSHGSGLEYSDVDIYNDMAIGIIEGKLKNKGCQFELVHTANPGKIKIVYFQETPEPVEICIFDLSGNELLRSSISDQHNAYHEHELNIYDAVKNSDTAVVICCLITKTGSCSKKFILKTFN